MPQPEPSQISWNQIAGMVLGASVVAASFAGIVWNNRRARIARRERPPQKAKLRRPAGYSLQCWVDELTFKLYDAVLQAIAAGSVLGLVGAGLYPLLEGIILRRFTLSQILAQPKSYFLLSLVALGASAAAWLVAHIVIASRLQTKVRNRRFGLRGEQAVAEALVDRTLIARGYVSFHDVPGDGDWNIDHVIVGPGGIFVLETKTRPRRTPTRDQEENVVVYDGQRLVFPWCEDRDAVNQVERNMNWVKQFIKGFAPDEILMQPLIVVPGWFVKTGGSYPVRAMNADYLVKYIAGTKTQYSDEQLRAVLRRLDERCRDLEF